METRMNAQARSIAWLSLLLLPLHIGTLRAADDDGAVVSMSAKVLRNMATTSAAPRYPVESLRSESSGVAVAEVLISMDGKVQSVRVLESPDRHIADAVATALRTWRFQQFHADRKVKTLRSRFVFYFRIGADRRGKVIDAQEAAKSD